MPRSTPKCIAKSKVQLLEQNTIKFYYSNVSQMGCAGSTMKLFPGPSKKLFQSDRLNSSKNVFWVEGGRLGGNGSTKSWSGCPVRGTSYGVGFGIIVLRRDRRKCGTLILRQR